MLTKEPSEEDKKYMMQMCDGSWVTDWNKIKIHKVIRRISARKFVPKTRRISGQLYTERQLEHFGDAVVAIAARMLTYEKFQHNQARYFAWVGQAVTNFNLGGRADRKYGSAVEVKVGAEFAEFGLNAAIEKAKTILSETTWGKHLAELNLKELE